MTYKDKCKALKEFKESEIYADFIRLAREYYDAGFNKAMDISLDEKARVSYLDFMNGVGKTMTIFNQLEEEYKVLDERENKNGK